MENILIISQVIFNSVFSLAIIVWLFFMVVGAYRVIKILKILQAIVIDLHDVSDEAKARIKDISEKLSLLPILSFFMKKVKKARNHKAKVKRN